MSNGKIVQIIGAVVDVEFSRDAMPKVFEALKMQTPELTMEVQQQLGDGIVRAIAMGSTDGLRRGMEVLSTGNPIMVPVGQATLGRIMNVLGTPIDEADLKTHWDYIYEPDAKPVVDAMLMRYIESLVYQGVAENIACEQSARMVAMKAASDNAKDVIGELKLVYDKARQAAITKELSEIVAGAAAV